jgi:RNA polymerase sigma-70 factor (ECF subfamily)
MPISLREQEGEVTVDADHARWFFEEVQPHEPKLRAYLRHRFPTLTDVDDIVQETYVRLFRERRAGKRFEAQSYLFPVARNVAFDVFRRSRTVAIGDLGDLARLGVLEEERDVAETVSQAQEIELLHEAIRGLPERCREIFVLRRLQGMAHREIANRLGISEKTVDAQLCIAIFRCRQYLVARGVTGGQLQNCNTFPPTRTTRPLTPDAHLSVRR